MSNTTCEEMGISGCVANGGRSQQIQKKLSSTDNYSYHQCLITKNPRVQDKLPNFL